MSTRGGARKPATEGTNKLVDRDQGSRLDGDDVEIGPLGFNVLWLNWDAAEALSEV